MRCFAAVICHIEDTVQTSEKPHFKGLASAGLMAYLINEKASFSGSRGGMPGRDRVSLCLWLPGPPAQLMGGTIPQDRFAAEWIGTPPRLTCDRVHGLVQILALNARV
jgi:hypothetical protein